MIRFLIIALLSPALLSFVIIKKESPAPIKPLPFYLKSPLTAPKVWLTWETGDVNQGYFLTGDGSFCNPPEDAIVDGTFSHSGGKSLRLTLRNTYTDCQGSPRTDKKFPATSADDTTLRFFDFWIRLDSNYATYDPNPELFFQIHQRTDIFGTNKVPMNIQIVEGRYRLLLQFYKDGWQPSQPNNGLTTITQDLGPVAPDTLKWVQWTFEFVPRTDASGIWRIWKNGAKIYERIGANYNLGQDRWYPKIGMYKWRFKIGSPSSTVTFRRWWLDDLKLGTSANTIDDFITPPTVPVDSIGYSLATTSTTCYNSLNGAASITATGGNGTFSYSWSNGSTTPTISGVGKGTYTCTITSGSATKIVTVVIPGPLAVSATGYQTSYNATTNLATIYVDATGGTGEYTFSQNGVNFFASGYFTQTAGTTVTYTAKDNNGCTGTITITASSKKYIKGYKIIKSN